MALPELQRDLELERRKSAGLQDSLKERDKEYQKLKVSIPDYLGSSLFANQRRTVSIRQDQTKGSTRS